MNAKLLPFAQDARSGSQKRWDLVESAIKLFSQRGFDNVSVAEIAQAVDAFPNQVTHHFGGKEGLFVEAASRGVLRAAKKAEKRTRNSESGEAHARSLVAFLLGPGAPAVMMFAEAMLMARRKSQLQAIVRHTIATLHEAGEAAMVDTFIRTGWKACTTPEFITRAFWSAILGLALEKAAAGDEFEYASAEAVVLMIININGNGHERQ